MKRKLDNNHEPQPHDKKAKMVWPCIRIQMPSWNAWRTIPLDSKACTWREVADVVAEHTGIQADRQLWVHNGKLMSTFVANEPIYSYISEFSNNVLILPANESHYEVKAEGVGTVLVGTRAPIYDMLDHLEKILKRQVVVGPPGQKQPSDNMQLQML